MVMISNKVLLAGGLATAIGLSGCKKYRYYDYEPVWDTLHFLALRAQSCDHSISYIYHGSHSSWYG